MMKALQTVLISYEAVDGTLFNDEAECRSYEQALHPHLVWCLRHKYTHEKMQEEGIWRYGYNTYSSHTEYEPPAFLREGGDYTVTDSHETTLGYFSGTLSEAVSTAVDSPSFLRHSANGFIKKIAVQGKITVDTSNKPS